MHTGLPIRRASLLPEEDVTPGRSGAFELGEIEAPDNPRMVATSVVPLPFALEEGSSIRAPPERTTASCGSIPDALNAHAYRHVRDGRPPASCSAFHCSSSSIEMTCSLSVISRRRMRLERIELHTLSRLAFPHQRGTRIDHAATARRRARPRCASGAKQTHENAVEVVLDASDRANPAGRCLHPTRPRAVRPHQRYQYTNRFFSQRRVRSIATRIPAR